MRAILPAEPRRPGTAILLLGLGICVASLCVASARLHRLRYGELEVRYGYCGTAQALAIAEAFHDRGIAVPDPEQEQAPPIWIVDLRRDAGRHVVEVTRTDYRGSDSDSAAKAAAELSAMLSTGAFGGEPVNVATRGAQGQLLASVRWEHRMQKVATPGELTVWYSRGGRESEARRLARALAKHASVFEPFDVPWREVWRAGVSHVVEFWVEPGSTPVGGTPMVSEPGLTGTEWMRRATRPIQALAATLSHEVFDGEPVEIRLWGGYLD